MPEPYEDPYRTGICVAAPGFLENLIPHGTEVVLQFRKSITYVEYGKVCHNDIGNKRGAIGMACELNQVCEWQAVPLRKIVPKDIFLNAQVVPSESSPVIIALSHMRDDLGNYGSYNRGETSFLAFLPGSQKISDLTRIGTTPVGIDKASEHVLKRIGTQLIASVEAECESTTFDRSGN